jgi:hypothetical protein
MSAGKLLRNPANGKMLREPASGKMIRSTDTCAICDCTDVTGVKYYPLFYCPAGTEETGQVIQLSDEQLPTYAGKVVTVPDPNGDGFGTICVIVGSDFVPLGGHTPVERPATVHESCEFCCDCAVGHAICNSSNLPSSLILHMDITLVGEWTRAFELMVYRSAYCEYNPTLASLDYRDHDPTYERMGRDENGTLFYQWYTPQPLDPEPPVYPQDFMRLYWSLGIYDFNGENESSRIHDAIEYGTLATCNWYFRFRGYCVPQAHYFNPTPGGMTGLDGCAVFGPPYVDSTVTINEMYFI